MFRSTDALWEQYRGLSPYVYSHNNPINFLDDDGNATKPPKYYNPSNILQRFANWFYGNEHLNEAYDFRQSLPKDAAITGTSESNKSISYKVEVKGKETVSFTATFSDGNDLSENFMDVPGPSVMGVTPSAGKGLFSSLARMTPRLMKESIEGLKSDLRGALSLMRELAKGNMNPGICTKYLQEAGVYYARGKKGARVFFRKTENGIEILGIAHKNNEDEVIKQIIKSMKGEKK